MRELGGSPAGMSGEVSPRNLGYDSTDREAR